MGYGKSLNREMIRETFAKKSRNPLAVIDYPIYLTFFN